MAPDLERYVCVCCVFVSWLICYNYCYSLPSDDASSAHSKRAKHAASRTPEFISQSPIDVRFVVFSSIFNDISHTFSCSNEPSPSHISEGRSITYGSVSLGFQVSSILFLPSAVRSPMLAMMIMRKRL